MNENENESVGTLKSKKGIESHKVTAFHLEKAVKHHQDAIKHHEAGHPDKAAQSTIAAQGHVLLANEIQKEETKRHANTIASKA